MLQKSHENRLRLMADAQGYILRKNPIRLAYELGNYAVVDRGNGIPVNGGFYDLGQVEEWLSEEAA